MRKIPETKKTATPAFANMAAIPEVVSVFT